MTRIRYVREVERELEERCQRIAGTLRFRASSGNVVATEQELAAYWPGGEENKDKDLRAWIFCYANYVRFNARTAEQPNAPDANSDEIIRALADTPEAVSLLGGGTMACYPKSFIALQFIERCDARIEWLCNKRDLLLKRNSRNDLELIARVNEEIAYEYGVVVWAATHKAPGLPFSEVDQGQVEIPEEIRSLTPIDLLSLRNGFIRVNALSLHALIHLMKGDAAGDDSRRGWKTFFAIKESETGVPASALMRDRSLVSQVASSLLVADAQKAAMEESRQEQSLG